MNNSSFSTDLSKNELGRFCWPTQYDSCEIINDKNNEIRVFENIILGKINSEKILCFSGTNLIITCTPHYFHYLKEYYASFLYYKNNYDKSSKYLWIENPTYIYPKHQDMCNVCEWTESLISKDCAGKFDINILINSCVLVERLVVIFDGQQVLAQYKKRFTDYTNTPGLNMELRSMFIEKGNPKVDKNKKIFISRRLVSKELKDWNYPHLLDSVWLNTQRRLRYHPDWVEEEIENIFSENGYSIIQPSGMPMDEQISIFANATHVAGLLGTGFYNGIFCKPSTKFTALRINPDYWYDFEGDIKSVIDVEFGYIDMSKYLTSRKTIREHLTRCMLEV